VYCIAGEEIKDYSNRCLILNLMLATVPGGSDTTLRVEGGSGGRQVEKQLPERAERSRCIEGSVDGRWTS